MWQTELFSPRALWCPLASLWSGVGLTVICPIKPWTHHSWLLPRDPFLAEKAARVLDLYYRFFDGVALGPDDYVISADEKTSIQAGPMPHHPRSVEFEYERKGALAYVAAWDVHRNSSSESARELPT